MEVLGEVVKKRFIAVAVYSFVLFLFLPVLFSTDRWSGSAFDFLIRKNQLPFIETHFESLGGDSIEEFEPNLHGTIDAPQFRLVVSSNVASPFDITMTFKPMKLEGTENYLPYTVRVFQEGGTVPWVTLEVPPATEKNLGPLRETSVDGALKEFFYLFALEFDTAIASNLMAGNYKGEIKVVINEGS